MLTASSPLIRRTVTHTAGLGSLTGMYQKNSSVKEKCLLGCSPKLIWRQLAPMSYLDTVWRGGAARKGERLRCASQILSCCLAVCCFDDRREAAL